MRDLVSILVTAPWDSKAAATKKSYFFENEARRKWVEARQLPLNESSMLLYLAERSTQVGSSSLAKIIAAYHVASGKISGIGSQLSSDLIRSQRRKEIDTRKQPEKVSWIEVKRLVENMENDEKTERDTLIVLLSFKALLRVDEAAELKWIDLKMERKSLEVRIRRAKNDQMALGRSCFVECPEGSELDCLLKRWRVRYSLRKSKSEYLFHNLNNGSKLSSSAISTITKNMLKTCGLTATHHALRRGAANDLQARGLSFNEIKTRGRWRSDGGLARYLTDDRRAQGMEVEEIEEEDEGPPVLVKETSV
uniref:Tyr recombinase domain-containing protein n=1 Tax=Caenorhabditis japonica TaxID=281687 RepID=A0A8R1DRX8_CAEJA